MAQQFTEEELDEALRNGAITEQEYAEMSGKNKTSMASLNLGTLQSDAQKGIASVQDAKKQLKDAWNKKRLELNQAYKDGVYSSREEYDRAFNEEYARYNQPLLELDAKQAKYDDMLQHPDVARLKTVRSAFGIPSSMSNKDFILGTENVPGLAYRSNDEWYAAYANYAKANGQEPTQEGFNEFKRAITHGDEGSDGLLTKWTRGATIQKEKENMTPLQSIATNILFPYQIEKLEMGELPNGWDVAKDVTSDVSMLIPYGAASKLYTGGKAAMATPKVEKALKAADVMLPVVGENLVNAAEIAATDKEGTTNDLLRPVQQGIMNYGIGRLLGMNKVPEEAKREVSKPLTIQNLEIAGAPVDYGISTKAVVEAQAKTAKNAGPIYLGAEDFGLSRDNFIKILPQHNFGIEHSITDKVQVPAWVGNLSKEDRTAWLRNYKKTTDAAALYGLGSEYPARLKKILDRQKKIVATAKGNLTKQNKNAGKVKVNPPQITVKSMLPDAGRKAAEGAGLKVPTYGLGPVGRMIGRESNDPNERYRIDWGI